MAETTTSDPSPKRGVHIIVWLIAAGGLIAVVGSAALIGLSKKGTLTVTGDTGPGLRSELYLPGQTVNIWQHEHWLAGTVQEKKGEKYLVAPAGSPSQTEWVNASRLQRRQ